MTLAEMSRAEKVYRPREYMGKNFASAGEISASQKFFKTIIRVMFPSPLCLESKVIPFINHIIESSLNEDSKKNIT